ncbi:DnaJ domain-containing protein [Candidatus Mesenet endosymbiont of Phosphuga atrata]|uniref:DnaJ domain-containing protein n=1 Tax=Candidatus Mesenet endosymbiont of Phosphuga atrata TaxID=3066221 RepID=UPI0030D2B1D1
MNISETVNSILYRFVNESTAKTDNENIGNMSKGEALKILGLTEDAKSSDVNQAYHNLMKSIHPDKGGSAYLAQKINEARDVLLK